jgi:uncharacterized protein YfiM (DUF2279 family)
VPIAKNTNVPTVAVLVGGILALLSLLLFIRIPSGNEWMRVSLDASHGPIFAVVAMLVASLLSGRRGSARANAWPDWPLYMLALAISIALGALIELLQGFEGRPPSFFDVVTDTAGALAGLSVWTLATRPAAGEPRGVAGQNPWPVVALGLAGVAFVLWRPMHVAVAYAHRAAAFPTIADFSTSRGLDFVTTDGLGAAIAVIPAPWAQTPGERALAIRYDPQHPPAVQVVEPRGDWRAFSVIAVDVANAGPGELALVLRILDASHDWSHEDRFNLPLVIAPRTRTTVRVALAAVEAAPATRRMDMARIANVMLFGRPPAGPGVLYVSRVWLE